MKPAKELPPREVLQELFHYDPETGALTWRKTGKRWLGKQAGKVDITKYGKPAGYKVSITTESGRKFYYAHRLIFAMQGLSIPPGMEVDHIDGHPLNNRWRNLRLATCRQNAMNCGKRTGGKSGPFLPKGVTRDRGRFKAMIATGNGGRSKYLGMFATPSEAGEAYAKAAKELHGEFARSH